MTFILIGLLTFFKSKKLNKKYFFLKYLEFLFKGFIDEEELSIFWFNNLSSSISEMPYLYIFIPLSLIKFFFKISNAIGLGSNP